MENNYGADQIQILEGLEATGNVYWQYIIKGTSSFGI